MDDHAYSSVSASSFDHDSWPSFSAVSQSVGSSYSTLQPVVTSNEDWHRYPTAAGLDAWSQAIYGQRSDWPEVDSRSYPAAPELEAYWASLSTADKIRGAVISGLIGGGIGGLLGYLIMY